MSKKSDKVFGGASVIYAAKIEKESVQDKSFGGVNYLERPLTPTGKDAIDYYTETVDYNAYHARCLRLKADVTVGLGMNVISGNEESVRKRLEIVNEYGESFGEVISRICLDFETTGNGYLEIVVGNGGKVEEFYFMPARRVYKRPRGSDTPFYYADNKSGKLVPMQGYKFGERKEAGSYIMSFAQYSQTCVNYGLPDWRGCVSDIELDYYSMLYNQKFFINSGVPDLAIIVEGGAFDKETQAAVTTFLSGNIKGMMNAHRTLYLPISDKDVKVRFEKIGLDVPKDASFDLQRSRCRDNIISAHGVYPRLVGVVVAGQLGGGGEATGQLKNFQEVYIAPRQKMWETKLAAPLSEMGLGDLEIKFEEMDTSIQESNSTYYPAMVSAGILTIEKAREELGYEAEMVGDDRAKAEREAAAEKVRAIAQPSAPVAEPVMQALQNLSKALDNG